MAGVALWLAVIVSVPLSQWPLRATFAVSRHSLETLANHVERGEKVHFPVRCGLLTITSAELSELSSSRGARLWLKEYGNLFASNNSHSESLVRGPNSSGYFRLQVGWFHKCDGDD